MRNVTDELLREHAGQVARLRLRIAELEDAARALHDAVQAWEGGESGTLLSAARERLGRALAGKGDGQ